MAQTFPMELEDFFEGLPIESFVPTLGEALEANQNGAGEIITADLGARLWRNEIAIRVGTYAEIEQIKARIALLQYAGRSLIVHSMPFLGPQKDPDGSILGVNVITLTDVAVNNRDIELSGFDEGYQLTVGDFMSFTYGSNPIRYGMHQFATSAVADENGEIHIEVNSFIRPGVAMDTEVTLIKPRYKAVLVPGSVQVGRAAGQWVEGVSFTVMQTLR